MKKTLLAVFVVLIVILGLSGYFYDDSPSLEIEQTIETKD